MAEKHPPLEPVVPPFPTTPGYQYPPVVNVGEEVASSASGAGGENTGDDEIRARVADSLAARSDIPDSRIEIEVQSGIVTLRGTVSSEYAQRAAIEAATSTPSVAKVNSELQIDQRA